MFLQSVCKLRLLYPAPIELEFGTLCNDDRFCLSVCPVPDPKSRTEGPSKLNLGRSEAHNIGSLRVIESGTIL